MKLERKLLLSILLIFNLILISVSFGANLTSITYDGESHPYNVKEVTLLLNNDKFEPKEGQMPPIILNDRTLVPVREVFEYLGGKVDWSGTERKVTITFGDKVISLWIDKTEAEVNGQKITLDVPAKIVNDKTMVPVRFISERGGLLVDWDQSTYTVSVKFKKANITNIGLATINGVNCLVATANSPITGYKYFSLPAEQIGDIYLRLVLDIENCEFTFDTTNTRFDTGILSAIRFGKQENDVNRIVLDLKDDTDYVVAMSEDRLKLYFAMAKEFTIPGSSTNTPKVEEQTSDTSIQEPKTSSGEVTKPSGETNKISGETTKVITSGDTNKKETITNNSGEKKLSSGEVIKITNSGENIVVEDNTESLSDDMQSFAKENEESIENDEEIDYDAKITSIKYSTSTQRIKIKYEGNLEYEDMVLTNPNRIVIDIQNAKLDTTGPAEIPIKNYIVTSVRFSQYTKTSVRVVLDLSAKASYKLYKRSSELQIEAEESTYKNIKYKKNTSNAQITLQGTQLSDLDYKQDEDMFKYTITFNKNDYDFGNGTMNIDDKYIKSIVTEEGKITISDTGDKHYAIRQSGTSVVITVRVNETEEEKQEATPVYITITSGEKSGEQVLEDRFKKRILVDVGHGGADPGACNGEDQEKMYNVKIAQYLYDILSQRDDLIVDINRTEDNDRYFTVETRLKYALDFNPDFIVSVHINSLNNKNYSGTLVLYSNNESESNYGDITSQECAQIITDELAKGLGTINRGIIKRDDLHILHDTPCPSVLCEVGFISNDEELARLKTTEFQKKAAESIYNGMLKIFEEM